MPHRNILSFKGKIDNDTFETLYRLYWKKVFGVCLFHTRDEDLAKELVQDIFKSLWERRDRVVIEGSAENYLVRAAKFKVLEHHRNRATRRRILDETIPIEEPVDNATEDNIVHNELVGLINQIVGNLSGNCREVYILSREEGLSNREIANRLGISLRTVEYHLTNAMRAFRLHLSNF